MSDAGDRLVVSFETAKRQVEARKPRGDGGEPPPVEGPPPDVDWARAPFECLGVNGDVWWFVDAYAQVIGVRGDRLSQRGPLNVLLGGDAGEWAATHFPERNKEGQRTGDFSPRHLHKAIAARMRDCPWFDPNLPRRGPGVWAEGGKAVVHTGGQVFFPEGVRRPSFVRNGVAWLRAKALEPPSDGLDGRPPPADGLVAMEVEELFRKWNWDSPNSDRMLLGWWAIANLGALAALRPLCMVDAQEGAGKTTLMDCVAALSPAAEVTNDTTEAGLRQLLSSRAAPCVLDEFEGSDRQEAVLGLLRRIVTGDGSRAVRGQADQTAKTTQVVGTAIVGAIGAPVPSAAERSRTLRLKIWPRASGAEAFEQGQMRAWCGTVAAPLWGRVLAAWPRIQQNFAILRPLVLDMGATARGAELVAYLVGAREAMVADLPLDDAQARLALEWAAGWIEREADQAHDTTAGRCLAHLMSSQVALRPGENPTVAELLGRVARLGEEAGGQEATRILAEIGLRLAPLPLHGGGVPGVYVAAGKRPGLNRLFQGTEWAGGRWATVLAQLRAFHGQHEWRAAMVPTRIRFSGENDRAASVWLARELLPAESADAKAERKAEDG